MALNKVIMLMFVASICDLQQAEVEGASSCILEQLGQADLTLQQRTQELSHSVQQLTAENRQLNTSIPQLVTEGSQLLFKAEELEYENDQLNALISSLQNNINGQSVKSAFSAYMTSGYFEPKNTTQIVVPINGVSLNLNGNYNSATSTYTCPVSGVYYFSYAVYSSAIKESADDRVYAFIAVDGKDMNDAYCQTDTYSTIYCQATNSITLHCNQGSRVQVKSSSLYGKVQIYGAANRKRTTFTGHLVYPDDVDV